MEMKDCMREWREKNDKKSFSCGVDRDMFEKFNIWLAKKKRSKVSWLIEKMEEELKKEKGVE